MLVNITHCYTPSLWPLPHPLSDTLLRPVIRLNELSLLFHNQVIVTNTKSTADRHIIGWLVGCFGLNGPLRQYFSLYSAFSQRRRKKREDRREKKKSKQPPPAPTASTVGPCPTITLISRTPRHWKFTQHLRTTRPPLTGI